MRDFDKNAYTVSPKRYFPGGNTARGFVNKFSGIVPPWCENHYSYIIKGGPGVGKSTLMKQIAKSAREMGYITEEFHCSGDPESLDALRIPGKKVVLLDGTAPHSIDPKVPGAGQEIVNLGCFKNKAELRKMHPDIEKLSAMNSRSYGIAYSYLAAAGELKKSATEAIRPLLRTKLVESCIADFLGSEESPAYPAGRRLFSSAITHKGVVDLSRSYPQEGLNIAIGWPAGGLFLEIAEKLCKNRRREVFHDPLLPEYSEKIHLPELKLSFILTVEEDADLETKEFLTGDIPGFVSFNVLEVDKLIGKAVEQLRICKELHDELEGLYRKFVDFTEVDRLSNKLREEIFP